MKKIFFAILVLVGINSFGQRKDVPAAFYFPFNKHLIDYFMPPVPTGYQTRIVNERIQGSFMVDSAFNMPRYYDTTAANLHKRSDSCGAEFYSYKDKTVWMRICPLGAGKYWAMTANSDNVFTIINNYLDSNYYQPNDSTLIICFPDGCDTISIRDTYYFLDDSTLITCDDPVIVCPTPETCAEQTVCDTFNLSQPLNIPIYQNLVRRLPNSQIREGGAASDLGSPADMIHDTWYNTGYYKYTIYGKPLNSPILGIEQRMWSQISSSIFSQKHYGAYRPDLNLLDEDNPVKLYTNYFNPFTIPTSGALTGDTVGFMGNRYGYSFMTNARGTQNAFALDDVNAKQSGIFFDTYTPDDKGVGIFTQQVPSTYFLSGADSTLNDKVVAWFKTNQQVQLPKYTSSGTFKITDTTNNKPMVVDASGNLYRSTYWYGGGGGGSGTINSGTTGKPAYYVGATTLDDFIAVDYATSGTNVLITTQNTTDVGLEVKGQSSQSANFLNVSSSSGTGDIMKINSAGEILVGGNSDLGAFDLQINKGLLVANVGFDETGLIISPDATLSANGMYIINSSGTTWSLYSGQGLQLMTAANGISISPAFSETVRFDAGGGIRMGEMSAPSTPAANKAIMYVKSDGLFYGKDDAGVETKLSNDAGGTPTLQQVFNTEVGGSVLTKNDTIDLNNFDLIFLDGEVGIGGTPNGKFRVWNGTASWLVIDPDNDVYDIGDINGTGNSTYMELNDAAQNIDFNANGAIRWGSDTLSTRDYARLKGFGTQGTDVASSAGAITLGVWDKVFEITGTAAITLISNIGRINGAEVTLIFTSTATLTDGTANSGTDIGMELASNSNFSASADDVITLVLTEIGGVQRWREKSRSVN